MTDYVVTHAYTGEVLAVVTGCATALDALDAYADHEGFPTYSALAAENPGEWGDAVYEHGSATLAVMTNYEIAARPCTDEVDPSVPVIAALVD